MNWMRYAKKLEEGAQPDGLMLHYVETHGDWLALKGGRRNGIAYYVGNVLFAIQRTSVNFGAALYAPLRFVVSENDEGGGFGD